MISMRVVSGLAEVLRKVASSELLLVVVVFVGVLSSWAQRPQDNWYLDENWTKTGGGLVSTNGGLSVPYGVAAGPEGRIYVGDEGYGRIQVYQSDGAFLFSITNGFWEGLSFSQPRGMVFGWDGLLYVADYGRSAVYVFEADGAFVRTIGYGTGSGDGQLSGAYDVGVAANGEVFVLERGNSRVSVFDSNGVFLRKWGGYGLLNGQLYNPLSLAVSPSGKVYICQHEWVWQSRHSVTMKQFDSNGVWVRSVSTLGSYGNFGVTYAFWQGGASVRVDPSGYPHVLTSIFQWYSSGDWVDDAPIVWVYNQDLTLLYSYRLNSVSSDSQRNFRFPCHALGRDGSSVLCSKSEKKLWTFRQVFREQWIPPRNAIPIPVTSQIQQRPSSPIVDIDYRVSDLDDATVTSAMLIFTNSTTLACCLRTPSLIENSATNLGSNVPANMTLRLTWNAGADWITNLGNFRVMILAKDSRQKLLDIHYLDLPAEYDMPALRISRSPLIESDFAQVWWWLLGIGDQGIRLTFGKVFGNGGAYDGLQLWDGTTTSSTGRAYLFQKMGLREATAAEVTWAKQASTVPTVEQWTPSRVVAGRPLAVNEYGFDTGNWGSSAWWVVPIE